MRSTRSGLSLPPASRQVSAPKYCLTDANIRPIKGLHLAWAGLEHCHADYYIKREGLPCYGIEFVASGSGRATLNGHRYPLHRGVFLSYGPGIHHELSGDFAQPMLKFFAIFFGHEASGLFSARKPKLGHAVQVLDADLFQYLFDQMIAEGARNQPRSNEICASYLRILLLQAARAIKPVDPHISVASAQFHRCRDFIDANYHQLRNLDDVATALHIRPAYLCRLFKQFGQPGPFRYLTGKKMNRAAELLMSSDLSVKRVALDLAYEDPLHFSRLFRKHFGYSPLNFIKRSSFN